MDKTDSLTDFYQQKWGWLPDNLQKELGHFNVFTLEPYIGEQAGAVPYKRRDFFKITFFKGTARINYADKSIDVKRQALVFSNPQIPYEWEGLEGVESGFFCIFNQEFFHQFGNFAEYPIFKAGGHHLFELTDEQADSITATFRRMQEEIQSNYQFKYDILRTLVLEMLHFAMKLQPSLENDVTHSSASQRIASLFAELLDRQFPIENKGQTILRSPSQYAQQLNVHTNHLNRSVKEITGKTTSETINERLAQEARILLRHTQLSISEIGYLLGFNEATHFTSFFKKQTEQSPSEYRKTTNV